MTVQVRALLYYLRRYLAEEPIAKKQLIAAVNKGTAQKSGNKSVWRHTHLKKEPTASVFLIYLTFLVEQKALRQAKDKERGTFIYTRPELLRPKK